VASGLPVVGGISGGVAYVGTDLLYTGTSTVCCNRLAILSLRLDKLPVIYPIKSTVVW